MKTVISTIIDGFEIIVGIGNAQIDAEATKPIMFTALKETPEYIEIQNKKSQMTKIAVEALQSMRSAKAATTETDKTKYSLEWQTKNLMIKDIQEQIKTICPDLKKKQIELIKEHAIYFHPKPGEKIISVEDAKNISDALNNMIGTKTVLDINLQPVLNYFGAKLWEKVSDKWFYRIIIKLGEGPTDSEKFEANLNDTEKLDILEQFETDRILNLKNSERKTEKIKKLSEVVKAAALMKSELEIKGDEKALEKATKWYNEKKSEINDLYGE